MAQASEILEILRTSNYKEVFKAVFAYERAFADNQNAKKMLESESLENLFKYFTDKDFYTGFFDTETFINEYSTSKEFSDKELKKISQELDWEC